jgi:hypothetical protein
MTRTSDQGRARERDTVPTVDVASSNLVIHMEQMTFTGFPEQGRARERDTVPTVDVASSNPVIRSTWNR